MHRNKDYLSSSKTGYRVNAHQVMNGKMKCGIPRERNSEHQQKGITYTMLQHGLKPENSIQKEARHKRPHAL